MFLLGIGGHLKVSHMDPRVSFGNESTNLSVQKSFFKIIAPYCKTTQTHTEFLNDVKGDDTFLDISFSSRVRVTKTDLVKPTLSSFLSEVGFKA